MKKKENHTLLKPLIDRMSSAVRLKNPAVVTKQIKKDLEELIQNGQLNLPSEFKIPQSSCYARRLLHQDEELGFVIVAMTWGPGQKTQLHDHAGIWCVEGVIEGEMSVTQYELIEKKKNLFKFVKRDVIRAGVGGAGALIPPHEHHILANALKDQPSVTLHVYGGEINRCNVFVSKVNGWYEREECELNYHH